MFTATIAAAMLAATVTSPTIAPAAEAWESMQRTQSPPSVWTAATRSGAWLYGDSITVGTGAQFARTVHARTGQQTAIDANSGIPTRPAVDRLAARVAQRGAPRVLIMATGANDVVDTGRAAKMSGEAARVRNIVGPNTRIVWVTASVERPRTRDKNGTDKTGTATVNTALRASGVVDSVADWHRFLSRRAGLRAYYLRDGVHPNTRGQAAWVEVVAGAAGVTRSG